MEMYTIKEVAEILKVTEGTVRNYLSDGKIKHIKILGNTRVTKEELDSLIREGKNVKGK